MYNLQANQSEQQSNAAGASQPDFTQSRTPTSQFEREPFQTFETQNDQAGSGTSNQSGTGDQSGRNNQSGMETENIEEVKAIYIAVIS